MTDSGKILKIMICTILMVVGVVFIRHRTSTVFELATIIDTMRIEGKQRMMYPYITLADETLITHSHILDDDNRKTVEVHFERPKPYGFDMARCSLPSYKWVMRDGFSDEEILFFEQLLHNGAHTFFKYSEAGGMRVAKAI